jgi:hypothetical protein
MVRGPVNEKWRICYNWKAGDTYEVEITDYRSGTSIKNKKLVPIHMIYIKDYDHRMHIDAFQSALPDAGNAGSIWY